MPSETLYLFLEAAFRINTKSPDTSGALRAQPELQVSGCLLILVEEVIVGSVWHELRLAHRAGGSWSGSPVGV